jgi:hypothetical protein
MPDSLLAAQGYLELGMFLEALAELERLPAEEKNKTDVLAVRLEIYREAKSWEHERGRELIVNFCSKRSGGFKGFLKFEFSDDWKPLTPISKGLW